MIDESKPETNHSWTADKFVDAGFFYTSSSILYHVFSCSNLWAQTSKQKKNTPWFAATKWTLATFSAAMPNNSFWDSFGSDKTAAVRRCLRVKKSNFKTKWWTRIKKHPKTQNSGGGSRFSVWYLTTLTKGCLVSSHCNSLRRSLWSEAILSKDANPSIRDQQKKIWNISWWVLSLWKGGKLFPPSIFMPSINEQKPNSTQYFREFLYIRDSMG